MKQALKSWIKLIVLLFGIQTVCRLIFSLLNYQYFNELSLSCFIYGLRFDWVATSYLFGVFLLLFYFQNITKSKVIKKYITPVFLHLGLQTVLLTNLIDSIYYNFTFKRTTADIFDLVNTGNDTARLIPQFLRDYWYMILIYVCLNIVVIKIYKRVNQPIHLTFTGVRKILVNVFGFLVLMLSLVLGARGGWQLRPLSLSDTARYATGPESAVVLNTPFSILLSIQSQKEKPVTYFEESLCEEYYSPIQNINGTGEFKGKNVVLILLESFGEEYIGFLSKKETYTPFLDSLMGESLVFANNRSNGLKSIEALPSILAGIPSLMNTPYTLSSYSTNQISSLPKSLKEIGYSTSFYHAGENGTFGLDAFCYKAGIERYYGLDEYPKKLKELHYDGNWGIFDEPYLQYFAEELSKKKTPFFSSVFTISSHHPYSIPDSLSDKFRDGPLKIHPTIGYVDFALKKFFQKAQKMDWFKNTLFIITADHPAQSQYEFYSKNSGRYKVPLVFYDPNGTIKGVKHQRTKHADLYSSILGLVTDSAHVLNFGQDIFKDTVGFVVNYKSNSYLISNNNYSIVFDGEEVRGVYSNKDSLWQNNLIGESSEPISKLLIKGKAYIQQYKNRIIQNNLVIGERR